MATNSPGGLWEPFVFASDVHGDQQDKRANEALWKFLDEWKPVHRVMGGDLWDFCALRGKADEEQRRVSIVADFEAGQRWLERFRPTHFLRGNHDERLWKLAALHKGPMSDYAAKCCAEAEGLVRRLGCAPMRPYHRQKGVVKLGKLTCIHGYTTGPNAVKNAATVYGDVVQGHGHTEQRAILPRFGSYVTGTQVGCLCVLDMEYVEAKLNAFGWVHGVGAGVVNKHTGDYHLFQVPLGRGQSSLPFVPKK